MGAETGDLRAEIGPDAAPGGGVRSRRSAASREREPYGGKRRAAACGVPPREWPLVPAFGGVAQPSSFFRHAGRASLSHVLRFPAAALPPTPRLPSSLFELRLNVTNSSH